MDRARHKPDVMERSRPGLPSLGFIVNQQTKGKPNVPCQFVIVDGLFVGIAAFAMMMAAAVVVQFVQVIHNRIEHVGFPGRPHTTYDLAQRVVGKAAGAHPSTVALEHGPDLLDDLSGRAFICPVVAVERRWLPHSVPSHSIFDIPFDDACVLFPHTEKLQRFALGRREFVPQELQEASVVR